MRSTVFAAMMCGAAGLIGCSQGGGAGPVLAFSYERPARIEIPARIKTLAVKAEPFEPVERMWYNRRTADQTAKRLKAAHGQGRYTVIEQARLQKMIKEADLEASFGTADAAAQNAGKLSGVDAIVYVRARDHSQTRSKAWIRMDASGTSRGRRVQHFVSADMNFTMVDLSTGSTLASLAPRKEYYHDSGDRDEKKGLFSFLRGKDFNGSDANDVLCRFVDEGVQEFVDTISPKTVQVKEKLADGKSPAVAEGHALALADDYAGALEQYRLAMDQNADDHGAAFNAGLMHEAMGQFDDARTFYARAVGLNGQNARYAAAVERVKR